MRTPVNPIASAGVHASEAAGRPPFVIRELLKAGLLHRDILTVAGDDLGAYGRMPEMDGDTLIWRDLHDTQIDDSNDRPVAAPFPHQHGMRNHAGNLARTSVVLGRGMSVRVVT